MKMKKTNMKKLIAISQILSMMIEIFAISFIIGGMTIGVSQTVIAETTNNVPTGCCAEAVDGSICQEMNSLDEDKCKTSLLATSCNQVESCQIGCCYDRQEGICSLNSPKQRCEQTGGNWSNNAQCDIQECQLGCCILGDQASITTPRECTKISAQLSIGKNYQALDADGSCDSKVGLTKKGACTSPASDFSGENDCKFTTKDKCGSGNFYEDYLCTSKELNTNCFPSKITTCTEDSDRIYYLDTCGNLANIYDATKYSDKNYWETMISPEDSCKLSNNNPSCGNCDYTSGSICSQYRPVKDAKPTFGNNICRNLNCANGKKHGESWCVSDYANTQTPGVAPVGSRWFVGSCLDGEISVSPCADYNQETCIQSQGTSFSEAKCQVNEWRSCLAANEKETYDEVARECKKYEQCTMFFDISGNEKYLGLPGFKKDVDNVDQGKAGDVGKDLNKVIPWCVPKYTPGMVFWSTEQKTKISLPGDKTQTTQTNTQADSGGSLEETKAICSIGSFTCVSHQKRECELGAKVKFPPEACLASSLVPSLSKCESWEDEENWECNIDGATQTIKDSELPKLMEAMNERFRMIGSCGSYVNVAGNFGSSNINSTVKRTLINEKGDAKTNIPVDAYKLSDDSLSNLKAKSGLIPTGKLNSLTSLVVLTLITGRVTESASQIATQEAQGTYAKESADYTSKGTIVAGIGGGAGALAYGSSMGTGLTLIAAAAAYAIASMIAKNQNWSPGKSSAWINAVTSTVAFAAAVTYTILTSSIPLCATGILCPIVIGIAAASMIYTNCIDNKYDENRYYTMDYTCEAWEPPAKGDCNLCNNDIRTCSENRCRSLGLNCHYFNDNGEPGWCASTNDIWSATIKPWPEGISEGYKYSDVGEMKFAIESNEKQEVSKGTGFQFGIITDKQAQCKIDSKHTSTIDEMAVDMTIDSATGCESGNCVNQGIYHRVGLSSSFSGKENSVANFQEGTSTLALNEGENELYIRCKNYAGQYNKAEFVVKVIVDEGPDYTPPTIMSFSPASESYLKVGSNSSLMVFYVNEPAECKYSQGKNLRFEEMDKNAFCMNDKSSSILSRQPCYALLSNLTAGNNKFYFQCRDQPEMEERTSELRNINRNSKEYSSNVCSTGLNITRVSPDGQIVTGKSPISLTLEAETSGCINGGEATCYYQFNNESRISFLNTGKKIHSQIFDNLPNGEHNINIYCEDEAGNSDTKTISINVNLDNTSPFVIKSYTFGSSLYAITDENSQCGYVLNSTLGCEFKLDSGNSSLMDGTGKIHATPYIVNQEYFIKCQDIYGNANFDCGIKLKTYGVQKE